MKQHNNHNNIKTNYEKYSAIELLELSQNGDQNAFAELYNRYSLSVYQHAYLFYQDYDQAQDITQELFTKLWSKRDRVQVKSNFPAYIHRVVRHMILNKLAHQKIVQKFYDSVQQDPEPTGNSIDDYISEKELIEILNKKINKLPKKMREIFILSREEQKSHEEISKILNISKKTVRQQIYNALTILKKSFKHLRFFLF